MSETGQAVRIAPAGRPWSSTPLPPPTARGLEETQDATEKRIPDPPDMTRMDLINAKMEDPEADPAEICRLIAAETGKVTRELSAMRNNPEEWKAKYKTHSEVIKNLRETANRLNDAELLSRKDILRFDGEKFKFAMGRFIELFVKAMKEGGIMEDQRSNVMHQYRDLVAIAEQGIRRDTEKVESSLRRK